MSPIIKVLRRNLQKALRARQLEEAANVLARLKEADPVSVNTRGLELEYRVMLGHSDEALDMSAQLTRLYPASARIQYLAGRAYYLAKRYPQAAHCFIESDRLYPHWLTRRWLGKSHTQQGNFSEAEALLLTLIDQHAIVALDLAWLYERKARPEQALQYLEEYLRRHPQDNFAKSQHLRLKSLTLDPDELVEEVENLQALDEPVPAEIFITYVQGLLETGRSKEVRDLLFDKNASPLEDKLAASIAWICHRLHAYDLALHLFLQALPAHLQDYKYLSALESAARRCQRINDVIKCYENYAEQEKRLYGRIKGLKRVS